MGWGEPHSAGTGTTGQIEDAHAALDAVGVPSGSLARRAVVAAGVIRHLRFEQTASKPPHPSAHSGLPPTGTPRWALWMFGALVSLNLADLALQLGRMAR